MQKQIRKTDAWYLSFTTPESEKLSIPDKVKRTLVHDTDNNILISSLYLWPIDECFRANAESIERYVDDQLTNLRGVCGLTSEAYSIEEFLK